MSNTAILEYGLEQAIQDPLCVVEYFRSLRSHALCMVQVGYSEIEGEVNQRWTCSAGCRDPVPMVITIDIEAVFI